jgi:hypothetical protein
MIRNIHIGIAVLAVAFIASGCVSSGTFEKMQAGKNEEIMTLQQQKAELEKQRADLAQQKYQLEVNWPSRNPIWNSGAPTWNSKTRQYNSKSPPLSSRRQLCSRPASSASSSMKPWCRTCRRKWSRVSSRCGSTRTCWRWIWPSRYSSTRVAQSLRLAARKC